MATNESEAKRMLNEAMKRCVDQGVDFAGATTRFPGRVKDNPLQAGVRESKTIESVSLHIDQIRIQNDVYFVDYQIHHPWDGETEQCFGVVKREDVDKPLESA